MIFPFTAYDHLQHALQKFSFSRNINLLSPGCSLIPNATLQAFRAPPNTTKCSPQEVEARYSKMPPYLEAALLPFQREGVKFCLERRARCLIGDEMGVGKTVQAIATASCYKVSCWCIWLVLFSEKG